MAADALNLALAQSEVQLFKMQVILHVEHGHGYFLINKDKWTQLLGQKSSVYEVRHS